MCFVPSFSQVLLCSLTVWWRLTAWWRLRHVHIVGVSGGIVGVPHTRLRCFGRWNTQSMYTKRHQYSKLRLCGDGLWIISRAGFLI